MSELIDRLIAQGYTGISVERFTEKEETGGYQDEHKCWSVVARNPDGAPVRVSAERHIRFSPGASPSSLQIDADKPLSQEEYDSISESKGIVDTEDYRNRLAARWAQEEQRAKEHEAATAELDRIRPSCPSCDRQMVPRSGKYGWFWGCPGFPKCGSTKNMSAAAKSLVERGAS